jgi:hypothetical protein
MHYNPGSDHRLAGYSVPNFELEDGTNASLKTSADEQWRWDEIYFNQCKRFG